MPNKLKKLEDDRENIIEAPSWKHFAAFFADYFLGITISLLCHQTLRSEKSTSSIVFPAINVHCWELSSQLRLITSQDIEPTVFSGNGRTMTMIYKS